MKSILSGILVIAMLAACNNKQKPVSSQDSEDSIVLSPDTSSANSETNQLTTLCFQRVEGKSNQDISTINLLFDGNDVLGTFNWNPQEKDSRKGTIKGIRTGDIIKGVWSFMQEGTSDTLSIEFKLSENELLQKTFGIDKNTGRQKLTDTSTFSIKYQKIECNN